MRYGPIVAERFKRQYFTRPKGSRLKEKYWAVYHDWDIQPEKIYLILRELKSKEAIEALVDRSWMRRLPKPKRKGE